MNFRETSAFPGWSDCQLAREALHHADFSDRDQAEGLDYDVTGLPPGLDGLPVRPGPRGRGGSQWRPALCRPRCAPAGRFSGSLSHHHAYATTQSGPETEAAYKRLRSRVHSHIARAIAGLKPL